MGKFLIRAVPSGLKFDLYAANGQTILTSEVYTTPAACRKGIASVAKNAPQRQGGGPDGAGLQSPDQSQV